MDSEAGDRGPEDLVLPRVQPNPNVEPEFAHRIARRARAPDSSGRTVERRQKTVTGGVDLRSTPVHQLVSNGRVVTCQ